MTFDMTVIILSTHQSVGTEFSTYSSAPVTGNGHCVGQMELKKDIGRRLISLICGI